MPTTNGDLMSSGPRTRTTDSGTSCSSLDGLDEESATTFSSASRNRNSSRTNNSPRTTAASHNGTSCRTVDEEETPHCEDDDNHNDDNNGHVTNDDDDNGNHNNSLSSPLRFSQSHSFPVRPTSPPDNKFQSQRRYSLNEYCYNMWSTRTTTTTPSTGSTIAAVASDSDYVNYDNHDNNNNNGPDDSLLSASNEAVYSSSSTFHPDAPDPPGMTPNPSSSDHPGAPAMPSSRLVPVWNEFKSLALELIDYGRYKNWKKKVLTVVLCCVSALVFYDLFFGGYILSWLQNFVLWMAYHPTTAVFAFVGIFVMSTLIFIPPTLLIFAAGYAFAQAIGIVPGIFAAIFACFLGSCIGACIAFVRARYMMRDLIYLFAKRYPLVRAADRALKRDGFRVMLLLRLCPLIPFNGLNYCCGITGVSLHDFARSLVGILPFQIFTAVVGATAGTLALKSNPSMYNTHQEVGWIILIASGVAFGIIALVFVWHSVRQELQKELELTPEEFQACLHAPPPDEDDEQQSVVEDGIEMYYRLPPVEGEEWFWVWA